MGFFWFAPLFFMHCGQPASQFLERRSLFATGSSDGRSDNIMHLVDTTLAPHLIMHCVSLPWFKSFSFKNEDSFDPSEVRLVMQPPTYSYVLIVLGVASICVLTKSGARIERYWKGDVANFDTQAIKQSVANMIWQGCCCYTHTHKQWQLVRCDHSEWPRRSPFVKHLSDRVACCRARQVRTRATRPQNRSHACTINATPQGYHET